MNMWCINRNVWHIRWNTLKNSQEYVTHSVMCDTFTGMCHTHSKEIHRNLWHSQESKEMCNTFLDIFRWNTPTNSQRCATHCIHRNVWHTPASHMCEITLTHSCGYECVSMRVSVYSYLSPYRYTLQPTLQHTHELQPTLQHTHELTLYMASLTHPPPFDRGR